MKKITLAILAGAGLLSAPVFAGTPCDEVKAQIEARIKAKGVAKYTLDVVAAAELKADDDRKVVGACEGGTKRIVYKRG